MTVSVVIVSWNTRDLLRECLLSVRAHAGVVQETIVVDNGSSDGSAAMVSREFPEAALIEAGVNLGFGRANNLAFARAGGRYLFLLNPDARLLPGALPALVGHLDAHPEVGAVGPRLVNPDGTAQNSFDNVPTLATELLNKTILKTLFPARYPSKRVDYHEPIEVESLIGAAMLVRRDIWARLGGFDPAFFFFLEETDWCLRMRQAGARVVHFPAAQVLHHQGAAKSRMRARAWIEYHRSTYRFFAKHRPPAVVVVLRVGRLVKLIANFLFTSLLAAGTLFLHPKARSRFAVYAVLLAWHVAGCPDGVGLPRGRVA
ncbi:MAG: glycosyltransferase family 2 protein [Planctomycetes bacterium]|nr:glycosyltransferase family 2 protein [Planctomycetota bacterium]